MATTSIGVKVKVADIPEVAAAFVEMQAALDTALWAEGVLRAENDHLRDEVRRLGGTA